MVWRWGCGPTQANQNQLRKLLELFRTIYSSSQVTLLVKNQPANAGDIRDVGWIPGSGRSPGGGNGNPLQYSCLENSKDRGTWWATGHGIAKSRTQLSTRTSLPSAMTVDSVPFEFAPLALPRPLIGRHILLRSYSS